MMPNTSCISIFDNELKCRQAIKNLQSRHYSLRNVSIIARNNVCNELYEIFNDAISLDVSGIGQLQVAGQLVDVYAHLQSLENSGQLNLQGSAFDMLLSKIGVPAKHIAEYQQAVIDNKILLLVLDAQQKVEQASEVLHNECQQVTVHRM